jgi:Zn-dependent M28 family amino/carboxypeptidase
MIKLNHKRLLLIILLLTIVVYCSSFLGTGPDPTAIDGDRIMATILDLTNEEMFPHRNVSLPGNREAAEYIAEKFKSFGLEAPPEAPNYLQEYDGQKANVIGVIRGSHPKLKDETIVIGGHFDTKAVFEGKTLVHEPGALDNASGTAVMMEIARVMAEEKPKRTLIFVAFNEEEAGFIGSDWLAGNPIGGVDPVAMVNLDMVGSELDHPIYICTIGYGDVIYPLQEAFMASGEKLGLEVSRTASGRTDHRSFATRGIPAISLFCWDDRFYHTAEDTPEKLSIVKLSEAGMLVIQWLKKAAY